MNILSKIENPKSKFISTPSLLSALIERGKHGPFAEPLTITPELAAQMLQNNADNRPIDPAKVAEIVINIKNN